MTRRQRTVVTDHTARKLPGSCGFEAMQAKFDGLTAPHASLHQATLRVR